MLVDLHCHEQTFSSCSHVSLADIVAEAKRKQLDALCITDHDSMGLMEIAHSFSRKSGYPIFVGTEIYTWEGDVVTFGLDNVPTVRLHLQELLELVREIKGVCFSAHPYRSNLRGIQDHLCELPQYADIAGVEIRNGRTDASANAKAESECRRLGLFEVGGSDAHEMKEVGCCATWLPDPVSDERELIDVLRAGGSRAAVYKDGFYQLV